MEDPLAETSPLLESRPPRISNRRKWVKLLSSVLLVSALAVTGAALYSPSSLPAQQQIQAGPLRAAGETTENGGTAEVGEEEPVDTAIQVEVEQGILQGKRMVSRDGREYLEFRGIPYAKPPLGELRFKPPQEPEVWEGVRDATKSQSVCIQKRSSNPEPHGSEDCLYLNIFTPKTVDDLANRRRNRDLFPVIFYVHGGGGGAEGDGIRYSGEYFMDQDVVLVTIDYRLGVLGSLNLNISEASGNQGQKDQVMGLKWVQANIQAFGGDKSRVTLFGNSAGAHQVSTHMISPMSKSLIHRAIVQSGTTILPGYMSGEPVQDGIDLGLKMNCSDTTNMTELLNCFMNQTAPDLVVHSIHLRHWFTFTYSVDTAAAPGDQFLPESPLTRLQKGETNKIPFMIGITSAEALPQALQVMLDTKRADAYNVMPWTNNSVVINDLQLQLSARPEKAGDIAEQARQFYFGDKNITQEQIQTLSNLLSDRLFHHPAYITAMKQFDVNNSTANSTTSNSRGRGSGGGRGGGSGGGGRGRNGQLDTGNNYGVYMYNFSHHINVSRCQDSRFQVDIVWGIEDFGVCHADELQFFFPNGGAGGIYPAITPEHPYADFSRMVVKLWATFAANGVPTGTTNNVTWVPLNGAKPFQALELNEDPSMIDFAPDRMDFWDQFNLTDLYR